jgi:hypothetical protein
VKLALIQDVGLFAGFECMPMQSLLMQWRFVSQARILG